MNAGVKGTRRFPACAHGHLLPRFPGGAQVCEEGFTYPLEELALHVKANFSTGITEQWGRAIIPHICFPYIPNLFCFGICVSQGTFTFLKATSCYTHQRIYLFFHLGLFQAYEGRVARISYSSWTQVWVTFPHFSPFTQFIDLDTRYPAYTILLSESSCLFFSSLLENSGSLWLLWSFMHYDKMHYLLKKEKKGSEVTAVTYR